MIERYVSRRAYHYYRMNVADNFDRRCLDLNILIQRFADLENDKEYIKLAQDYWILQGKVYNLKDDQLWIEVDWRIDYKISYEKNRHVLHKPKKPARFPLEDNLYETWKNLEENREKYQKYERDLYQAWKNLEEYREKKK